MTKNLIRDLKSYLPTANKDAQRMALFMAAVAQKAVDMTGAGGSPEMLLQASASLTYKWVDRSRKLSVADLFRDPYKALREETRKFAIEWQLSGDFIAAMG